jgi:hypothetical protein
MSRQVALSTFIYPQDCLDDAITAYSDLCAVRLLNTTAQQYEISIESLSSETDEKLVANEFLNYLLDKSAEHHLGKV